jgi:hypothetical protein
MGGEMRRAKSLRIGVHYANAAVWGPVYRTHLALAFAASSDADVVDGSERGSERSAARAAATAACALMTTLTRPPRADPSSRRAVADEEGTDGAKSALMKCLGPGARRARQDVNDLMTRQVQ